jgi:hypothetical protein
MLAGLPLMVVTGYLYMNKNITMVSLPKLEPEQVDFYPPEVWHKPRLWKNFPTMNTRLLSNTSPEHSLAVELTYLGTISNPDMLLYWSPRSYSVKSGIGESMHFLGTFTHNEATLYKLPDVARHRDGFLLLYSLAEDKIVTEAPLVNPLK